MCIILPCVAYDPLSSVKHFHVMADCKRRRERSKIEKSSTITRTTLKFVIVPKCSFLPFALYHRPQSKCQPTSKIPQQSANYHFSNVQACLRKKEQAKVMTTTTKTETKTNGATNGFKVIGTRPVRPDGVD